MQEAPLLIGAAGIEIFLFVAACAVLLADLFLPTDDRQRLHWAVVAGLGVAAMAAFGEVSSEPVVALNGFFIFTPLVAVLKGIILLAVAACLIFSSGMLRAHKMLHGDFFALALLATMGMLVIVSAAHFLTLLSGVGIDVPVPLCDDWFATGQTPPPRKRRLSILFWAPWRPAFSFTESR